MRLLNALSTQSARSEQQKLQEIEDIEVIRLKTLDRQKDELKRHIEALKTAIALTDKLVKMEEGGGRASDRLLEALDKRTTELESTEISDTPERHSHISFETVSDDDLIAKANELVGTVIPCEASAQHSFVEGNKNKATQEGQSAIFTLVAKDNKGKPLVQGGDLVRATVSSTSAKAGDLPPVEVKDNGNGRYDIQLLNAVRRRVRHQNIRQWHIPRQHSVRHVSQSSRLPL